MAEARLIRRWARAPGWDPLLDRADRRVRDHTLTAGHRARWRIKSKGGIDCYGACCPSQMDALSSRCTCSTCGQPSSRATRAPLPRRLRAACQRVVPAGAGRRPRARSGAVTRDSRPSDRDVLASDRSYSRSRDRRSPGLTPPPRRLPGPTREIAPAAVPAEASWRPAGRADGGVLHALRFTSRCGGGQLPAVPGSSIQSKVSPWLVSRPSTKT